MSLDIFVARGQGVMEEDVVTIVCTLYHALYAGVNAE